MGVLKFKNKYGIITVLLSLIFALSFFLPNMISNNCKFYLNTDYITQVVPYTVECQSAVKGAEIFWNWNTELGSNFIASYSWMIGNLFFWITFLFRAEFIPYVMSLLYIIKYILAAFVSFCYLRRFTKDPFWAMIAALMYAFSGFSLFNIVFYSFHEALILFPLMLISIERLIVEGKKGVFCLVVFLCAITSFYFFIGQVIFLFLYACIRIYYKQWSSIKRLGLALFEGAIGTILGSFILVPTYFFLAESTRATDKLSGMDILFYFPTRYLDILRGFVFPPEIAGINKFIISGDAAWGSVSAWLPFVGVAGVIAFMLKNKHHWLTSIIAASVIVSFVPFMNQSFQLFSNVYYTRWWYMLILLMALATVKFFECSHEEWFEGVGKKAVLSSVILYMVVVVGIFAWIGLCFIKKYDVNIDVTGYGIYFAFTLVCYLFVYIFVVKKKKNINKYVLIFTFIAVFTSSNYYVLMLEKTYIKYNPKTYMDMCFDKEPDLSFIDKSRERVEITEELTRNQTLYYDLMPLNFYHSLIPQSTVDFYQSIGLKRSVCTLMPVNEYAAIRTLLSVKWYFNDKKNSFDTPPIEGFRYYGEWKDYHIWENEYWLPFGFYYENYINYSDYMRLPTEVRDRVLLRALVIDDERESDMSGLMDRIEIDETDLKNSSLKNDTEKLKSNTVKKFARTANGFEAEIDIKKNNLIFFSIPFIKGWNAYVNGNKADIIKANVGFIAVKIREGSNKIIFEYVPWGLKTGLILSTAALVVIIMYWGFLLLKRYNR